MNADQLDRLGRIADTADNFAHATMLPGLPASIHIEGLTGGMESIRAELRELYVELSGGENPWEA